VAAGRKPKPTAVKKLTGNPGKRPLPKNEARLPAQLPAMPRGHLSKDAKFFWRKVGPLLAELGLITELDGPAFEFMSHHYGMVVQAATRLERDGLTIIGAMGGKVKHPAAQILKENSTAFRMFATEFGLTPSSRSRLEIPGDSEQSLAELLFGSKGDDES